MDETFGREHQKAIKRPRHSESAEFSARNLLLSCRRQADSSPIRLASE